MHSFKLTAEARVVNGPRLFLFEVTDSIAGTCLRRNR
jgi:hypothetical protein